MKKYILIGGAGAPNFGDELIVKAWKSYFKKYNISGEFNFFENIEKNSTKIHYEHTKNQVFQFRDDLAKIAKNHQHSDFWYHVQRGFHFFDKNGETFYKNFDFSIFKEAEVVHLHGGGYLNNMDPSKGFYIGFCAALKKHFNIKKLAATGIGIGPLSDVSKEYQLSVYQAFQLFDIFELRDSDGFDFLSHNFNHTLFTLGLDDCFLLGTENIFKNRSSTKKLYLSFVKYNLENFQEHFWYKIKNTTKNFDEVIFFESYPYKDKDVYQYLQYHIPSIKMLSLNDSLNEIDANTSDTVIASRFHVHFIFARLGCRGFYLKDSKYYSIKHKSIIHRGSCFSYLDPNKNSQDIILNFEEPEQPSMNNYEENNLLFKRKIADYIYKS